MLGGLAGLVLYLGTSAGCNDGLNNVGKKENQVRRINTTQSSSGEYSLETKLNKIKAFNAGGLKVPEDFDLTKKALGEGKGVLRELADVVDGAYGRSPVVLKISATWCSPCRDSYKEFVEFANERKDVKSAHLIVDKDIVGEETWDALKIAYGFGKGVPVYIVIDKAGNVLTGRDPVHSIREASNLLKDKKRSSSSDEEYAETIALARDFVSKNKLEGSADQVTVIGNSKIIKNNYELVEFLAEEVGIRNKWDSKTEDLAKKGYTYLDEKDKSVREVLAQLSEKWKKPEYKYESLCGLVDYYKNKNEILDKVKLTVRQATRVMVAGENDYRLLYNTNDFFSLIQEKTRLEIKASNDAYREPLIFSASRCSLTEVLGEMFIKNNHYRTRMFDMGEGKKPVLVVQKNK